MGSYFNYVDFFYLLINYKIYLLNFKYIKDQHINADY